MKIYTLPMLALFLVSLCSLTQGQWIQSSGGMPAYSSAIAFAVSDSILYAGTDYDGVFRSTNYGASWNAVNTGLAYRPTDPSNSIYYGIISFVVSGTNLFAGTQGGGVFLSTNRGESWTSVNTGLLRDSFDSTSAPYAIVMALAVKDTNLYAATDHGVYLSTNSGTNWTAISTGLPKTYITSIAVSGTTLFAGTEGPTWFEGGVFLSTNNGEMWTPVHAGLMDANVRVLAVSGVNIFVGRDDGVFRSTNSGASWTQAKAESANVAAGYTGALTVNGTTVFAGSNYGNVFLSTNSGDTWTSADSSLTNTSILSLAVSGPYLFAGTVGRGPTGVWRRPLAELATSVRETAGGELPVTFALKQNFPNPFNPTTTIRYDLPHRSHVTLTVYTMLGQIVATPVNSDIDAGYHEVQFNASNLASGVYFYRLQAENFVETRKGLLTR